MSECINQRITVRRTNHTHTVSEITDFAEGVNIILNSTVLNTNSADWISVYNTVNENSAVVWNYQGTDIKSLTANWEDTFNTVQTNSALNWQNDNNVYTFVYDNSAALIESLTVVQTNSATWNAGGGGGGGSVSPDDANLIIGLSVFL